MSSMPPNMPPGGGYPPYDPKTQWRVYREQQKAAWRAQRDAWRAQRQAWRVGAGSIYGPRVPSMVGPILLIGIGVVALMVVTGRLSPAGFAAWYGRWWPVLLIVAGLALLAEWMIDMRRQTPVRRSSSFVGILVLLGLLGLAAHGWTHMGPWINQWSDNDGFFNSLGMPEHDNDMQPLSAQIPADAMIDIENPRGDVNLAAGDVPSIEVQVHEVAYASSDSDAKKIFDAVAPHLTVSGSAVLLKSENNSNGRANLTVTVPRNARVTVNAGWDNVTAAGLGAGINITARGDIHLNSITGPIEARFVNGKHDAFSAHDIQGDVTLDGDLNDLTLSEIKGKVTQNGDLDGDVHLETISGPVHLHTSVTTLDLAALPGDLTLDSDDLRVTEATGDVRVTTHAKDVDLSQIYGNSYVENRDGSISVSPAGAYSIEAKDSKGDVEITLPPNASGTVDGHTHNGDIVTDYGLAVSGDEDKTVTGKIGSGGPKIYLSSDNGDLGIKKGTAYPPEPAAPAAPSESGAPRPPAPPNAPHLKSSKTLPAQPVTE